MTKRRKRIFIYVLPFVLLVSAPFLLTGSDFKVLETSVLGVLKNISEKHDLKPPDLGIDSVVLRKTNDPSESSNYYKYKSTIVIHNYGGDIKNARVLLHAGENQKHMLVRNTEKGFSLNEGKSYTIRGYEVVFDGNYNGGEITLDVELVDKIDNGQANNSYKTEIFEKSPKIKSMTLDEILYDGTYVLNFDSAPFNVDEHKFEILTGNYAVYAEEDVRYDEIDINGKSFGYYRIKNSIENVNSGYEVREATELESHFIDAGTGYAFIKAINPETGYYAVSNILDFSPHEEINRAQFAKLFVDYAGLDTFDAGKNYFEDVIPDEWYGSYVQTLYNLGLLDISKHKYFPASPISRGEVLRIVLDYFDVDLVIGEGAPHFEEISEDHFLYPYAEALYESGKGHVFDGFLSPETTATKDFLRYLVNEYSKSN